jgi:hypothetical protein
MGRGRTSLNLPCALSARMPRREVSTSLPAARNSRAPAAESGRMPKKPNRSSSGYRFSAAASIGA